MLRLNKLNSELEEISNNLARIEARMDDKQTEIVQTKLDIEAAKLEEARQYELMKRHLSAIYEKGDVTLLQTFLQTSNYADFLNKAEYVGKLEDYDRRLFDLLVEQRRTVEEKEEILEKEIEQLDELMGKGREKQGVNPGKLDFRNNCGYGRGYNGYRDRAEGL